MAQNSRFGGNPPRFPCRQRQPLAAIFSFSYLGALARRASLIRVGFWIFRLCFFGVSAHDFLLGLASRFVADPKLSWRRPVPHTHSITLKLISLIILHSRAKLSIRNNVKIYCVICIVRMQPYVHICQARSLSCLTLVPCFRVSCFTWIALLVHLRGIPPSSELLISVVASSADIAPLVFLVTSVSDTAAVATSTSYEHMHR